MQKHLNSSTCVQILKKPDHMKYIYTKISQESFINDKVHSSYV
jgi:hypothetical protein